MHGVAMNAKKKLPLSVRCPTCSARPGEKCELSTGLPRTEPHPGSAFSQFGKMKVWQAQAIAGSTRTEPRRSKAWFTDAVAAVLSSNVGVDIWSNP